MALPASGQISLNQVNTELGLSSTAQISLNDAAVRAGTYTRIDSGEKQAGVSAQAMQAVLPEVVSEDNAGTLSLAYGNAAMVSAVELAKRVVELEKAVARLLAK
jgi:hypothetical protein